MRKSRGFTLIEALIVIFLISIVSTIAAPGIMKWRSSAKLRGATENLKGNLQLAKLKAIQENGSVSVLFNENGYQIFMDNDKNWDPDSISGVLVSRRLPPGIKIDLNQGGFGNKDYYGTRFMGRATADSGTVFLSNLEGNIKKVIVSSVGRIRTE